MGGKMSRSQTLERRRRRHGQSVEPQGAEGRATHRGGGTELRYLPPYSPDMNPIEKAFSKLKAFLRKISQRTVAGLMNALETCAHLFKPVECANYLKACGYDTD